MGLRGKTANRGEWAEVYVFLKLLGEGRLDAGDAHLNRIPKSFVEVLEVVREETPGTVNRYVRDGGYVVVIVNNVEKARVPSQEFKNQADHFLSYLVSAGKGTVPVSDELADFSDRILLSKTKAPAQKSAGGFGGKADIVIKTYDGRTSVTSTMGFSVKSFFGSSSTLYNAGPSTQFVYEVKGMDRKGMGEFNRLAASKKKTGWAEAAALYLTSGWNAEFVFTANPVTMSNLVFIRESMPQFLALVYRYALLDIYGKGVKPGHLTKARGVREICDELAAVNPLAYPDASLYEKVFKDYLFASFAGMTGASYWNGIEDVNGGYVAAMPSGEILCHHASDRESFRSYLFEQTFVDYVSRSKQRWGTVQKVYDRYLLPLNASIRFKKI